MKKIKIKYVIYTMLILVVFISCNSNTTMFWNWKDVIGLSILGLIIIVSAVIMLIEWIKNEWKRFRKK